LVLLAHLALKGLQRRQGEGGKWNAPKCLAAMALARFMPWADALVG
jgi:hypothetical protein